MWDNASYVLIRLLYGALFLSRILAELINSMPEKGDILLPAIGGAAYVSTYRSLIGFLGDDRHFTWCRAITGY